MPLISYILRAKFSPRRYPKKRMKRTKNYLTKFSFSNHFKYYLDQKCKKFE